MSLISAISALESDPSPFARDQLRRIQAILAEEPVIPGIIERLVTPKTDGGYDWVNPSITDANFPTVAEPSLAGARLDKIVGSREYVLAELKRLGRHAANAAELLLYGVKNPEKQRKYWIWALAQVLVSPDSRNECAVALYVGVDGKRCAGLGDVVSDVDARGRVLSFPL